MIKQIEITPDIKAHKYKQPDFKLDPGIYYVTKRKPEEKVRLMTGAMAASINGHFYWVLPAKPFVQRVITGYIAPELALYGTETEFDLNMWPKFNLGYDKLRDTQREFLLDAQAFFKRGFCYKRGLILLMGGGKTLTGLLLGNLFPDSFLVFADTYYQSEWRDQPKEFGLLPPTTISTYESAGKVKPHDCIIIDEGNAVSNPSTLRFKRIKKLAEQAKCIVIMTGTPISVSQEQIRWLNIVKDGQFPDNDTAFKWQYGLDTQLKEVKPGVNAYVTETWDIDLVSEHASEVCLFGDISDLMKKVKKPIEKIIWTPKPKHFDAVLAGAATTTRNKTKARTQALMASDGHILNDLEIPQDIEPESSKLKVVKEFVERLGEPIFLVSYWQHTQDKLAKMLEHLKPAVIGIGRDEIEKHRFISGETRVMLSSYNKVKGLNFYKICRIIGVVSNGTSPLNREQLIARIQRPGQKGQGFVFDFCAKGTLDYAKLDLLKKHEEEAKELVIAGIDRAMNKMIKDISI